MRISTKFLTTLSPFNIFVSDKPSGYFFHELFMDLILEADKSAVISTYLWVTAMQITSTAKEDIRILSKRRY